ncbi:MAG: hypothetical protein FWC99_05150 [Coriobacteriia bacterium]|nr:hypothetical protein [Coriobacteriia bacterium]
MNSFCPYSGLNYDSSSHRSNSSHSPLYGEMRLKTANERRHQQDRRLSQGIALGLATLLIALTVAGMFWMQYSNAHAATSPYEVQSGS